MRKISKKRAKMEKNRFSILTDNLKQCYFCGATKDDLHELIGGIGRTGSMKYGLVIPLCRAHHIEFENNEAMKTEWKKEAEKKWLEVYAPLGIEDFIKIFGKSYI